MSTLEQSQPLVSVAMLVYNHERFLAQALESALTQNLDGPIEVVVGEDCSTDSSRRILLHFDSQYPGRMRLLLNERNIGMHANFKNVLKACRGEYIALLEGDDYWTAPEKLSVQLELLARDATLASSFHSVLIHDETQVPAATKSHSVKEGRYSFSDFLDFNHAPTCSLVFRRSTVPELPHWVQDLEFADWALHMLILLQGQAIALDRELAAYRIHPGGAWSALSAVRKNFSTLSLYTRLRRIAPSRASRRRLDELIVARFELLSDHFSWSALLALGRSRLRRLARNGFLATLRSGRVLRRKDLAFLLRAYSTSAYEIAKRGAGGAEGRRPNNP